MTSHDPDRSLLIRAISQEVVEESFPEELDLFEVVWSRFLGRVEEKEPGRAIGLPALGDSSAEFKVPFVVMTVSGVLEHLLDQASPPTAEEVERAVRQTAETFGLVGAKLDAIANAVAPKLHHSFSLMCGAETPKSTASSAHDPMVWVEWHPNKEGVGPESMAHTKALEDPRTKKAMLVIDEPHGEFVARGKVWSFVPKKSDKHRFDKRGFLVVWLALDRSNGQFRDKDISALRLSPNSHIAPSTLEHHAKKAREIFRLVVGKPILPRKDQMFGYAMRHVDWSWCWIRKDSDRKKSILLPTNASRENA